MQKKSNFFFTISTESIILIMNIIICYRQDNFSDFCIEMVNLTIALFARFRTNGDDVSDILEGTY